jgi:hypothetical protein
MSIDPDHTPTKQQEPEIVILDETPRNVPVSRHLSSLHEARHNQMNGLDDEEDHSTEPRSIPATPSTVIKAFREVEINSSGSVRLQDHLSQEIFDDDAEEDDDENESENESEAHVIDDNGVDLFEISSEEEDDEIRSISEGDEEDMQPVSLGEWTDEYYLRSADDCDDFTNPQDVWTVTESEFSADDESVASIHVRLHPCFTFADIFRLRNQRSRRQARKAPSREGLPQIRRKRRPKRDSRGSS